MPHYFTLAFVILFVVSVYSRSAYLHHYSSTAWIKSESSYLSNNSTVTFFVALKLRNIEAMKAELLLFSDPSSVEYGKYHSTSSLSEKYGPTTEEIRCVMDHFEGIEDSTVERNLLGDLLRVTAKVHHIERALNTDLGWHVHASSNERRVVRAVSAIEIPTEVAEKLSFVSLNTPIHTNRANAVDEKKLKRKIMRHRNRRLRSANATMSMVSNVLTGTTPSFLAQRYGFTLSSSIKKGSQSIAAFYYESYSSADLKQFISDVGLTYSTSWSRSVQKPRILDGGSEAVGNGVPTYMYSMSDNNPYSANEGFLEYLWVVGSQAEPALVHTVPYADDEATIFDSSLSGAVDYAQRVELEFVKMGLRGLTIVFPSGDYGVGGIPADATARCDKTWPMWPASSPYVTSVGGTKMSTDGTKELVCSALASVGSSMTSGGGFSKVNARTNAPWQSTVVSAYLAKTGVTPPSANFNSLGRGYPDLSIISDNYPAIRTLFVFQESSTALSATVFAAMVSLMNDKRLAAGKPSMGFINPFLYTAQAQDSTTFNDITSGDNACNYKGYSCCTNKFSASTGWDATSGLGSPNFAKLSTLAQSYTIATRPTFSPVLPPTTAIPSSTPTTTDVPTSLPTKGPTYLPTQRPTVTPTVQPSETPSISPSIQPTIKPSIMPSVSPSILPSIKPSITPSVRPSIIPFVEPSRIPSVRPSIMPSAEPSTVPTKSPTHDPTTIKPVISPTFYPTSMPSTRPTSFPTGNPLRENPSSSPTAIPSIGKPSTTPMLTPTRRPSTKPSGKPTSKPTTRIPSKQPTMRPSLKPIGRQPSSIPTRNPSQKTNAQTPSKQPTMRPSLKPIGRQPSSIPTRNPTKKPLTAPTRIPTRKPSGKPR
eukprot:gene2187-4256_t